MYIDVNISMYLNILVYTHAFKLSSYSHRCVRCEDNTCLGS